MASRAEMALILSLVDEVTKTARGIKGELAGVGKESKGLKGMLTNVGKGFAKVGAKAVIGGIGLAAAGIAGIGAALKTTIDPASDLSETVSKAGVVFGDEADRVLAFGKTAATSLGMTEEAALSAAGTYGNLFRSMHMAESTSADMSVGLVSLASDLASFNNLDPTDVLDKLRAGLTGETTPLKALGININAAMIEAKAMEMGLIGLDGELTAAAKAQASYALVMEQTTLAQGDFARTSDGLANQQRILSATMADLKAKVGTGVLPVMQSLMGVFTSIVKSDKSQELIQKFTDGLADLGMHASDIIALLGAGDVEGALMTMFGDETSGKIVAIANAAWMMIKAFTALGQGDVTAVMDFLAEGIYGLFDALGISRNVTDMVTDALWTIIGAGNDVAKAIGGIIEKVKAGADEGGIGGALSALFGALPDLGAVFAGIGQSLLDAATNALSGLWTTFAADHPEIADPLEEIFGSVTAEGGPDWGGIATTLLDKASKALSGIWATFATDHPELADPLAQIFGSATAEGGPDWAGMLTGIETLGTTLLEKLTPILQTAWTEAWAVVSQVEIPFTGGVTIGQVIDDLKLKVEEMRPVVMGVLQQIGEFVDTTLIPILAGLGAGAAVALGAYVASIWSSLIPALAAWGATTTTTVIPALLAQATAAWAAMAPFLPIIALVVAVGVAVGLLVAAWKNDWGGIRTFMQNLWTGTLQPIVNTIVEWFQVNIPAAISAMSGFWTNVLLPPIQTVVGFFTGTLFPLFEAIGSVYLAVWDVALTAMAGLWENVLLPAITAVRDFITGSVVPVIKGLASDAIAGLNAAVQFLSDLWSTTLLPAIQTVAGVISGTVGPALQSAGDTINTVLGPAIDWVTGLVDKATGGFGGIGDKIKEVTGLFKGLADKARNFKLPDVLTPGSPTPMEMGLRGIGAAIGPVVAAMLDFADSISGPHASALKKVASAFKDMAKGIDELAGSMHKLSTLAPVSGGSGGASAFGGWLDQFALLFGMAAERIQSITDEIGYNKIKKLRHTAKRLGDVIGAVLVDLSAIKARELPDLPTWFGQLHGVFRQSMVVMNAIRDEFGNKTVERAAEIAVSVGTVLQILGTELGAAVPPPPDYEALLGAFLVGLEMAVTMIMPMLQGIWAAFGGPILSEAVKTVEAITAIVGVLGLSSVLGNLANAEAVLSGDFGPLIEALLAALLVAVDLMIPMLQTVQAKWGEALDDVKELPDAISKVLGILGIDLTKLIPPPTNFTALLGGFLAALGVAVEAVVPMLKALRDTLGGDVLDEAALTSDALVKIVGVLSLASVLADLANPENAIKKGFLGMVTRMLSSLSSATDLLVPGLTAIQDKWGEALTKVATIAELMKRVFSGVADAQKSAVEFTTGDSINLGSFAQRIATLNAANAAAVTGLNAPTVTPTAPVVPGDAGAAPAGGSGLDAATVRDAIIEGIRGSELGIELSLVQDPSERARFSYRMGRLENMFAEFVTKWEASGA